MSETSKKQGARKRAGRAKKKKQKQRNLLLAIVGAGMLLLVVILVLPTLSKKSRTDMTATASKSTATIAAALSGSAAPGFTPVPTPAPAPTPGPELTPEPTPCPTPYVFQTAGRKLSAKKKTIALTFDDGPSATVTKSVLDTLKKHKVKATFFVLGQNAAKNKELMARMVSEGHQVGTHTYAHKSLIRLTQNEMLQEIAESLWAIEQAGGGRPTLLRPPYGNTNDEVCETIHMPMINWSVDTLDWESRNTKKVYKALTAELRDGDIVLMHDIYKTTAEALEKALPVLIKRGYQFVTIDEMFELKDEPLLLGHVYYSCRPSAAPSGKPASTPKPGKPKSKKK